MAQRRSLSVHSKLLASFVALTMLDVRRRAMQSARVALRRH
jgi:hypothetical protein